jgi:hypothetical protein
LTDENGQDIRQSAPAFVDAGDALWRSPDGHYFQVSADGRIGIKADSPDAPLEPGWHFMTEAEFESNFVEPMVDDALKGKFGNVQLASFGRGLGARSARKRPRPKPEKPC